MVKVSSLAITLSIIGVIIIAFAVGMTNLSHEYGLSYTNSSIAGMSKLNEINNLSTQVRGNITKMQTSNNFASQVDAFFSAGFSSLRILGSTADYGYQVSSNAINTTYVGDPSGKITGAFQSFIIILFIMLIFVGVFLYAITKIPM